MKTEESLNKIFDIETSDKPIATLETKELAIVSEEETRDEDFSKARDTLSNLIDTNDDVLRDLIHIAKNSEHPRSFEVAGQLIKIQADMAKDLIDIHSKRKQVDGEEAKASKIQTQNNIVFQGSTDELMRAMLQKEKIIDGND